jgi:hypothetical protein
MLIPVLLGILLLGMAIVLQTAVVSQITLLHGPADLILLVLLGWILHTRVEGKWQWGLIAGFLVGIASALPLWLPIGAYLLVTGLAYLLQTRVWQVPIMSLYVTTIAGTFIVQGISFLYLVVTGTPLAFSESLNLIILPSVILNSLLALPVYAVIGEVANWVYPPEIEA